MHISNELILIIQRKQAIITINLFDDIADDEEDKDALIRFLDKAKIEDYL